MGCDNTLEIERTETERGFQLLKFKDYNDEDCSLQQSSMAHYCQPGSSAVWLGVGDEGRMHLNRKMVKQLIEELSCWYYTGYFQPDEDNDEEGDEDLQEEDADYDRSADVEAVSE